MQKLIFINGSGTQIDLTSGNFGITNWAGLSNTGLNIQTQQVPFEDGDVFLDALMEAREIELTVAIQDNNNLELRYQKKRELIAALNPKLGEGTLIYTNDYLSRQIKAVPQIPLFENKNSNDAGTLKSSVAFTCCSPYWEDVEETQITFGIDSMPLIENKGDVEISPKIEIYTENVTNAKIENLTTNQKIQIDGEITQPVYINTESGKKEIYQQELNIGISNLLRIGKTIETPYGLFAITLTEIIKTEDNKNWTSNFNITGYDYFKDIVYSSEKNIMMAITQHNVYISSDNGNSWELSATVTSGFHFNECLMYDQHTHNFVIGCGLYSEMEIDGNVLVSEDGYNWSNLNIFNDFSVQKIMYISQLSKYILLKLDSVQGVTIIYMGDELTSLNVVETLSNTAAQEICYSSKQNKIVVMGRHRLVSSGDGGNSWIDSTISTTESFYGIANSQLSDLFMLTTNYGIWTSINAINWEKKYSFEDEGPHLFYSEKQELFIISGNKFLGTPNGENIIFFEKIGINISNFQDVVYYDKENVYLAITNDNNVTHQNLLKSNDGINWDIVQTFEDTELFNIEYIKSKDTILISSSTHYRPVLYISVGNLENWNEVALSSNATIVKTFYCEETKKAFMLLEYNDKGYIYISDDLINWVSVEQFPKAILDITYSRDLSIYTLVGDKGLIYNSTDGYIWNGVVTTQQNYALAGICYSELLNIYIAVGTNGTILYSLDSIKWNKVELSLDVSFSCILYCKFNGMFVIVGTGGLCVTSYDGMNFQITDLKINEMLNAIAENEKILVVGSGCNLLSYNSEKKNIISRLSNDSNMNMKLEIGDNRIKLGKTTGSFICRISYRQKYIGV